MAEPITFKCYKCKQDVTVDSALSGFSVACPHCEANLNVPVMMNTSTTAASHTKIKLKKDVPGHLKVEDPEISSGEMEEYGEGPQEEVEYIFVDEAPSPWKKIAIVAAALIALGVLGVGVFFGVNSYLAYSAKVKEERRQAEESAARAAALADRETRLKPVWDDAAALAERTRNNKTDVEHVVKVFESLKTKDFAGTKYEAMAETELQRLKLLADGVAEERKKAQAAAEAAARAQREQADRERREREAKAAAQRKAASANSSEKTAPAPSKEAEEAAKKAAQARLEGFLRDICKVALKGDWDAAYKKAASFSDKGVSNAMAPVFKTLVDQDKLILDSFKKDEGKEVNVIFQNRSDTIKILSVKHGEIQASLNELGANIQKNYSLDAFSPLERVVRIGRTDKDAAALMLMSVYYAKQAPDDAMRALEEMTPKAWPVRSLQDFLKREMRESLAEDEYERLLNKYHVRANMSAAEVAQEIAKMKLLTDAALTEFKKPVGEYKEKYKDTAYYKKVAAQVDAIVKAAAELKVFKPGSPAKTGGSMGKPSLNNSVKGGLK